MRLKIGRGEVLELLEVTSIAATANGSVITINDITAPAEYSILLAQGDLLTLPAGTYDAELLLVDDSETSPDNAAKTIDTGAFHVIGVMPGYVGLDLEESSSSQSQSSSSQSQSSSS